MIELAPSIYRVEPSKITPSKYISFFVERTDGNLLFPCVASSSTFETDWPQMQRSGGVDVQLLGDMHFATKHNDAIFEEFGAVVRCSELEEPDVRRKVENVDAFAFERIELAPGVVSIPTPGHRPGAVSYLVNIGSQRALFTGDSVWHDGSKWQALASKKNRPVMQETLQSLCDEEFDALYANVSVGNSTCSVAFDSSSERIEFLTSLRDALA